jgi:ribosome-binding protein aMBF1 (putative translation factor)
VLAFQGPMREAGQSPRRSAKCYAFTMHASQADSTVLLSGIGTEIRRRWRKLGISQAILAQTAGVHPNVVGRTERGIYNPTVLTLEDIATALGTSMAALLRGAAK